MNKQIKSIRLMDRINQDIVDLFAHTIIRGDVKNVRLSDGKVERGVVSHRGKRLRVARDTQCKMWLVQH